MDRETVWEIEKNGHRQCQHPIPNPRPVQNLQTPRQKLLRISVKYEQLEMSRNPAHQLPPWPQVPNGPRVQSGQPIWPSSPESWPDWPDSQIAKTSPFRIPLVVNPCCWPCKVAFRVAFTPRKPTPSARKQRNQHPTPRSARARDRATGRERARAQARTIEK